MLDENVRIWYVFRNNYINGNCQNFRRRNICKHCFFFTKVKKFDMNIYMPKCANGGL